MRTKEKKPTTRILQPLIGLFVVVVLLLLTYWFFVTNSIDSPNDRGVFGDMFGGITALFSGLAFAGMIYAIILQSRELALQREELALTRRELEAARIEQSKSAEAQAELVKKQVLAAQIQGLSAVVQGRYQYIAAYGANASRQLALVTPVEDQLSNLIRGSGLELEDFPKIN